MIATGCNQEISQFQTHHLGGRLYRIGDPEPFTGTVIGKGREGYRRVVCQFKKQYKNGILDGKSYFWYLNGKLESIEPYTNGKLNGLVTRYGTDGKIKMRIHLVDGQRGGESGEMFWKMSKK